MPLSHRCASAKKHQQVENITVEVEGDADRFACELQYETYRKALHKKGSAWESVKNEWNSGCDRPSLWPVYQKMEVGSKDLSAKCWTEHFGGVSSVRSFGSE